MRELFKTITYWIMAVCLTACATPLGGEPIVLKSVIIPLNPEASDQLKIGQLSYLGGLHLSSEDERFGGHSGLRWHDGRLYSIIDNGRWSSFKPIEQNGQLIGIRDVKLGTLHDGLNQPLTGKTSGDAEALSRSRDGNWLVGFERDHRILRYSRLDRKAVSTALNPNELFGEIKSNNGMEALSETKSGLFVCIERFSEDSDNCALINGASRKKLSLRPPSPLDEWGGVPTDADTTADGTHFILFRSYSAARGVAAGIVAKSASKNLKDIATLAPPLTVDNFEGLAVREIDGRIFIYLISDDNFSKRQRTLLLKFELLEN